MYSSTSPFAWDEQELNPRQQDEPELLEAWGDVLRAHYPNPGRVGCLDQAIMKKLVLDPYEFYRDTRAAYALEHINQCGRCADELVAVGEEEGCPGPADDPHRLSSGLNLPDWDDGFHLRKEINEHRDHVSPRTRLILLLRRSGRTWHYVAWFLNIPAVAARRIVGREFSAIHFGISQPKTSLRFRRFANALVANNANRKPELAPPCKRPRQLRPKLTLPMLVTYMGEPRIRTSHFLSDTHEALLERTIVDARCG